MSEILDHIFCRRSIRKYTGEPVSREDILRLLQCGMAAPSASDRQPWEFIVVTDEQMLARLRRRLVFGRYHAPLAIVVCGNLKRALPRPAKEFWIQDCAAATENILLAAAGLGLGAVWIGVHPLGPLVKSVSNALGIPKHIIPLGVVYVGHPAEAKEPRTRYDEKKVHWQRYGGRAAQGED